MEWASIFFSEITARKNKIILSVATLVIIAVTSVVYDATQSYRSLVARGQQLEAESKFHRAIPFYESAYARRPNSPAVFFPLLRIYRRLEMPDETRHILARFVKSSPQARGLRARLTDTEWREIAGAFDSLKDWRHAENITRRLVARGKYRKDRVVLAELLAWQKKYPRAVAMLRALINERPDDARTLEFLADVLSWDHQYEEAVKFYERRLEAANVPKRLYLKMAETLRYAGRDKEAVRIYARYLSKDAP